MFKDEIKDYTIDDLELIIETQKELYTKEEMGLLRRLLTQKKDEEIAKKNKFIEERLPGIIKCQKCDGPNPFSNDVCKFCGVRLNKKKYYKAASVEYEEEMDPSSDNADTSNYTGSSFLFQYIISFIIPIVGFIMGAIMMTGENEDRVSKGKICIVLGVVSVVIYLIILTTLAI